MMNISIIGAGYVGLITGIGFAKLNNRVSIIDLNTSLIEKLKNFELPFYEPDLQKYINDKLVIENINYCSEYESGIDKDTELVFVCVQTPTNLDSGKTDTKFIKSVLEKLKELEKYNFNICIKSTVKSQLVEEICNKIDIDFSKIVFNPEFLREGSALDDFFNPDRVVVGGQDNDVIQKCLNLYKDFDCELISTDPISSQMIKYLSNTYLAMRLSFVNETYRLVKDNGGNPLEVLNAIGKDIRIGNNYFRPSPGWGGSCFPKDVKEVENSYNGQNKLPLISKIIESNELQMDWFSENLFNIANQQDIDSIVLIGAAFKENTDDLRESPTLKIYDRLQNKGLNIVIFDKNIDLNSDYSFIAKLDDLKANCLYVEMFPDVSDERKILISKIRSLNNTFMLKMWE
ncbi:nucleotide sugar dehydrogenase [Acidimicrobiaceae bacterium]|nr:nucleotide sugar dehydrogenase [Acidimicrobiaceae bacterium]